ncbi:hypothetical protein ABZS66_34455 [Dactylosporangium sp. NPDC005572]|uniref:hypothetical protein n=1 Tax=Dactylosporangium sp. NPDC005572 TaxID=3156889 RepID=UPI0033BBBC6C
MRVIAGPPGFAEFAEPPDDRGRFGSVLVPAAGLPALLSAVGSADTSEKSDSTEAVARRVVEILTKAGELHPRYRGGGNRDTIAHWCVSAGVAYDARWTDGSGIRSVHCGHPLLTATEPNGHRRILLLQWWPATDPARESVFGVRFSEVYEHRGGKYTHEVDVALRSAGALAAAVEEQAGLPVPDADDGPGRLRADLAALVGQGVLGAHLPPQANRDRVVEWCRAGDVRYRIGGRAREHEILRAARPDEGCTLVLGLRFWAGMRPATVRFEEEYRAGPHRDGGTVHAVVAPLDAAPALADHFEGMLGRTFPGRADDRLIACFDALAADGRLAPDLPRQVNRGRVAEWFATAGVEAKQEGFMRTERLLRVHRTSTDCVFQLVLRIDPEAGRISFHEEYDYLPQRGDAGREYSYGVRTRYTSLATLVEHLSPSPSPSPGGRGDLEGRLARAFRARVASGELADGQELGAARDRVTSWFTEAGVDHEPADWFWVNSD